MKIKPIKPKEMSNKLGISPKVVSKIADEIEETGLYQFNKTAISGSFHFKENEGDILKLFLDISIIYPTKIEEEYKLDIFREYIENKQLIHKQTKPEWISKTTNIT